MAKKKKDTYTISKKCLKRISIFLAIIVIAVLAIKFAPTIQFSEKGQTFNNIDIVVEDTDGKIRFLAEKSGKIKVTQKDIDDLNVFYKFEGYNLTEDEIVNQSILRKILLSNSKEYLPSKEEVNARNDEMSALFESVPEEVLAPRFEAAGVTLEEFKELSKERLKVDLAIQGFLNEEILPYVGTEKVVTASHILICYSGATGCEENRSKKEAEELTEMVKALTENKDFAELAREYSDGPSGVKGGDLGPFTKGVMVSEFEDAAFSMEVNETSDLVETQFGYHIIKVTDIGQQPDPNAAADVQYKLFTQILEQARQ